MTFTWPLLFDVTVIGCVSIAAAHSFRWIIIITVATVADCVIEAIVLYSIHIYNIMCIAITKNHMLIAVTAGMIMSTTTLTLASVIAGHSMVRYILCIIIVMMNALFIMIVIILHIGCTVSR